MGTKPRSRRRRITAASGLAAIDHFVVLMLENRSFDHMLGYMKNLNPYIAGMAPTDFNYEDPIAQTNKILVGKASGPALTFDPAHEFTEVGVQLYGPAGGGGANPPSHPAPMSGFVCSSRDAAGPNARNVMECFEPHQLPVFTKLADEFAIFNFWYSSMPGPTWPNRFFVHASTSGGLFESPGMGAIIRGFTLRTIYDRLQAAGKSWRIYHEDMPQAIGIKGMLSKYLRGPHFRVMSSFYSDVKSGELPAYTFIEPRYDAFNDFIDGNSMHPHNDVAHGEQLIKSVYEAIRNSKLWPNTLLIVTFDEHGGFYDHLSPPDAPPTGDDSRYASEGKAFAFDQYGIRVPTVVVSAYTDRQTVIGNNPNDPSSIFDHSSILATVQKRFGLAPLSKRDSKANTVDVALKRASARNADAPKKLPAAPPAKEPVRVRRRVRGVAPAARPMTKDQEIFLALAIAVDREMTPSKRRMSVATAAAVKRTPAQASAYAAQVQARALARRGELLRTEPSAGKRVVRRKRTLGGKRPVRRKED